MVANQRPVGAPFNKRLPHPSPKGPILSEDIFVCCIGHAFGEVPPTMLPPGAQPIYFVTDFLIDQSQSTNGGSVLADPIQFDLTQSTGYMYQILAACGKRFHVKLPVNVSGTNFSAYLGRQQVSPPSGVASTIIDQVSFQGLIGTPPTLTYNNFFISQTDNSHLFFEIEGEITSSLQFEGITLQSYFSRGVDPGAKWYNPLSYAVPLGTKDIYPKSETFVCFGYQTSNPVDPGPFVTLA